MVGVTISQAGITVTLKGPIETLHAPRLTVKDRPSLAGDSIQHRGRHSRRPRLQNATIYTGSAAGDLSAAQQLRTWTEGGTPVTLASLLETLLGYVETTRVTEKAGANGFIVDMDFVEASNVGNIGGVSADEVAKKDVSKH